MGFRLGGPSGCHGRVGGGDDSLTSDLAKDGLLAVGKGGGDLGMAVPGLASFLAFLSRRPQTPGGQGGGGWAGREGPPGRCTLPLPLLFLSAPTPPPISLSHFIPPP